MKTILTGILLMVTSLLWGQVFIGKYALLKGNAHWTTNGSVSNQSSLNQWQGSLKLSGNGSITTSDQWILDALTLSGYFDLKGDFTVLDTLTLLAGELNTDSATLLLDSQAIIVSENDAFINGGLFHQGSGTKFYPIGENGTFTPVTLAGLEIPSESIIGLEAFNQPFNLEPLPANILQVSQNWYWELTGHPTGAVINLPITEEDREDLVINEFLTVLSISDDTTAILELGGEISDSKQAISSSLPITGKYLMVGTRSEQLLKVRLDQDKTIYPNPFRTQLNIKTKRQESVIITIYDGLGNVMRRITGDESFIVDTSKWPEGAYYVLVVSDEKRLIRKVIKL